jgi:hypothetical protein
MLGAKEDVVVPGVEEAGRERRREGGEGGREGGKGQCLLWKEWTKV